MSDKKFYETTITVSVFTEDPIPANWDLSDIVSECYNDGPFVMGEIDSTTAEISRSKMLEVVEEFGDPDDFEGLYDEDEE